MFINTQVTKDNNGVVSTNTFTFEDKKASLSNHHYFMSSSYANENLVMIYGTVQDDFGNNAVFPEYWHESE